MRGPELRSLLQSASRELLDEASGRERRNDPVLAGTGGPAGNARLTGWMGLLLLVLFLAELVTALDVRGLITWHLAIGALLVPPALLKTASTGWRMVRYYTGNQPYRDAGPPLMPLRMLGPLVVLFTLAVLGSGLALIAIGPEQSRTVLISALGQHVDAVTIHQVTFIAWAVVTGLHTLVRLVPATQLALTRTVVPGRTSRTAIIGLAVLSAAAFAILVVDAGHAWRTQPRHPLGPGRHHEYGATCATCTHPR